MADGRTRKLIKDKTSTWDKLKVSLTPGLDVSERTNRLKDLAEEKVRQEERQAQLEAVRRKRLNAQD